METSLAPILLFTYNRPEHTALLLNSLKNCELSESSELFIFIDAPKLNATKKDIQQNIEVSELVKKINHFKKVTIHQNVINKGVDKSIMDGVTQIINQYEKVIVLEDDLIVGHFFLTYMNWGLKTYELNQRIYSINGFMFPIKNDSERDIALLPYISSWGWATWRDRWQQFKFDEENRFIISESEELKQKFNIPTYEFSKMLINNKECWDINWYFHVFKQNGLGVFPKKTLVKNMGFDGSGVHCPNNELIQEYSVTLKLKLVEEDEIDLVFYKKYLEYFKSIRNIQKSRVKTWIRKMIFSLLK